MITVAAILAKTLAALLVPGAGGTLAGEAAGAWIERLAGGTRQDRRLLRDIERTADNITKNAIVPHEYSGVPEEDIAAAIDAIGDTLGAVPVDAVLIRETTFSADRLYDYYREQDDDRLRVAALGAAEPAYEQMLREVSRQVTGVLLRSDEAQGIAIQELFAQLSRLTEDLDFPATLRRSLDEFDDHSFRDHYRSKAGRWIAWIRLDRLPSRPRIAVKDTYVEQTVRVGGTVAALADALGGHRRIVLLGPPGSGKSMALRHAFLAALQAGPSGGIAGWGPLMPLYLDVRAEKVLPPLDQAPERVNPSMNKSPNGWADQLAQRGHAVVLLDGLENILCHPTNDANNIDALEELVTDVADASIVVLAARQGTIGTEWIASHGFTVLELQPFGSEDVALLIRRWHAAVAATFATTSEQERVLHRGEQLIDGLARSLDLAEMIQTPLFASLACQAFLHSDYVLPDDWILLADAVLELLAARDAGAMPEPLPSVEYVREVHRAIAIWSLHNGIVFSRQHLAEAMAVFTPPPQIDDILAYQSVLYRHPDGLSFVSAPIRDHLAAQDLVAKAYIGFLARAARSPLHARVVVAAIGRLGPELAAELLEQLLDGMEEAPNAAETLAVVARRGVIAARNIDPAIRDRLIEAAERFAAPAEARRPVQRRRKRAIAGVDDEKIVEVMGEGARRDGKH
ncbi:hypothetical protein AB0875_26315 [Micromonospora gifhornensis]|uniref:NACHT domain-containing protein n=1 Tax=Micromonospora gifhornensis TaxID=84594 RepID=UPI003454FCFB